MRRRPVQFDLFPRHKIYMLVHQGDAERFHRLFRRAWSRLPLSARRRILSHWADFRARHAPPEANWALVRMDNWSDKSRRGKSLAYTHEGGTGMMFRAKVIRAAPDEVVQSIVAHELAHVFQCARDLGWSDGLGEYARAGPEPGPGHDVEDEAYEIAGSWGFDQRELLAWVIVHLGGEDPRKADCA